MRSTPTLAGCLEADRIDQLAAWQAQHEVAAKRPDTTTTTTTTTYRERREARAERLRSWADKRDEKAGAAFDQAHALASVIPFGQPILAGHHSEGRDRRYRDRISSTMDRALEHADKAAGMRSRADNIAAAAAGAIYSDDPDALAALTTKLERLEAERTRIKAYNASCRRGERDLSLLDDYQRERLLSIAKVAAFQVGKNGEYPRYALTNLGGTISATRKRLDALKEGA
jgi:hypothetical protein